MLRGDSGLPGEYYAVLVGAALAHAGGRDPAVAGDIVRAAWHTAHTASRTLHGRRPGVAVGEADPFALGVHRVSDAPFLPEYFRRPHDDRAAGIVAQTRDGASRILPIVGLPGSGRARTAWEAVRALPDLWRIWCPDVDPATAVAAAEPYTVVWLTDGTDLLQPAIGTAWAAEVRALTDHQDRSPVLVVILLWPEDATTLTEPPPPGEPDPHAAVRALLQGRTIVVPDVFTHEQLTALQSNADPVLRAGAATGDDHIAQLLADVPGRLGRYRQAPATVRTIIDTAVDARRFGHPPRIPVTLLRQVLDDDTAAHTALAWAADAGLLIACPAAEVGPTYRLTGAVHHAATSERTTVFPPAPFWDALAATVSDPAVLRAAGEHAERRGRIARAAQMYHLAMRGGDPTAITRLSILRKAVRDHHGADALAGRAAQLGHRVAIEQLSLAADEHGEAARADALANAAASAGNTALACQLAGRHPGTARAGNLYRAAADHGDASAAAELALIAYTRGDADDLKRYGRQAAAGGDTSALRRIAELYRTSGAAKEAERFAVAAARYGSAYEHRVLREEQRWFGRPEAAANLLTRIADDADGAALRRLQATSVVSLTRAISTALRLACRRHTGPLRALAADRQHAGDRAGAVRLAVIAARCADPSSLTDLTMHLAAAGDHDGAIRMAERSASFGDSTARRRLARVLRRHGRPAEAERLLALAAASGDPDALFDQARTLHQSGDIEAAEPLYRAAARGGVGDAANTMSQLLQATDPAAAARYAQLAEQLGHPTAPRDLGLARELAGDLPAAAALYRHAADHGDDTAAQLLARLWDRHARSDAGALATAAAEHGTPAILRHLAGLRRRHNPDEAAALAWSAYTHGDQQSLLDLPHMRAEDDGDPVRAEHLALGATVHCRRRAVADLGTVRALTGDLAGAERLYRRAAAAGIPVDVRTTTRARMAGYAPPPLDVTNLYEQAGAHIILARRELADGNLQQAIARCILAVNAADPEAIPELARIHRTAGNRVAADMIERYGLADDGEPAAVW
ncbi:hypothetical protein ACQP00_21320 [Dactylosporangium sp. CS-047395]|uniref:hypothetical protein n=1 Tax=Dactylosporangium sp. CS-047395 TaxID=3239936 RepID=UPI003D8AB6AF